MSPEAFDSSRSTRSRRCVAQPHALGPVHVPPCVCMHDVWATGRCAAAAAASQFAVRQRLGATPRRSEAAHTSRPRHFTIDLSCMQPLGLELGVPQAPSPGPCGCATLPAPPAAPPAAVASSWCRQASDTAPGWWLASCFSLRSSVPGSPAAGPAQPVPCASCASTSCASGRCRQRCLALSLSRAWS